jgi:arylsulfatase A-like enzyme
MHPKSRALSFKWAVLPYGPGVETVIDILKTFVMLFMCAGCTLVIAEETIRPNILIILADDLGWNDLGYHGSPIETPNIDRIAHEGIELDRFYAQPSCSPTRAGLMTGKIPMRLGIYRPLNKSSERGIPLKERLMPEYLADLGYQSFMVGKWHLGHHKRAMLPNQRGFEHFYGSLTGGIGYWNKVHGGGYDWQRNGITLREEGYVTHLLVDEIRTLLENRDERRPNFMYAAFQAPHLPNEAPEETVAKYEGILASHPNPNRLLHAAMVDELDQAIGEVLSIYEEQGMLQNTVVLFVSDNGGLVQPGSADTHTLVQRISTTAVKWFDRPIPIPGLEFLAANSFDGGSDNSPLPGGKTMATEGGVRVPAAIWWPGYLENGVHVSQMTIADVLPTMLDAIGARDSTPVGLDGRSQLNALNGGVSERPDYAVSALIGGLSMYRWPWKLIGSEAPQLFNVQEDPLEQFDLAASEPDLVAALTTRLATWDFAEDPGVPFFEVLVDPDTFGGGEDGRLPWPETVID